MAKIGFQVDLAKLMSKTSKYIEDAGKENFQKLFFSKEEPIWENTRYPKMFVLLVKQQFTTIHYRSEQP
jgi:hypothetical protein